MKTTNILTGADQKFAIHDYGNWSITGASASVDTNTSIINEYHSIKLIPNSAGSTVTLVLSDVPIPTGNAGQPIQFHSRIFSPAYSAVNVTLEINEAVDASYEPTRLTRTGLNSWAVCRSNRLFLPDTNIPIYATITISITEHGGVAFWFTLPFLFRNYLVDDSKFAMSVYTELPEFILQKEQEDQVAEIYPDYPIMRLIESGLFYSEYAFDKFYEYEYLDIEQQQKASYSYSGSKLVNPLYVDKPTAAWLTNFLGFTLDNPENGLTPWAALPGTWKEVMTDVDETGLDASPLTLARSSDVVTATFSSNHNLIAGDIVSVSGVTPSSFDGTFTISNVDSTTQVRWSQVGDNVADGSVTVKGNISLVDTEWQEVEQFSTGYYDYGPYYDWQLSTGYRGIKAGTREAVIEAAKFYLLDTQIINLTNNYLSNPWSILVKTKTSETPEGVDNTESEAILAAVNKVKPLGFKIYHLCTSTGS